MRGFAAPVFQNILRHPDADYRLPPVIVLFGRLVVVYVDVSSSGNAGAGVMLFVYMVLLLYEKWSNSASAGVLYYYAEALPLIYLLVISRLLFFSAFGENFGPTGASGSARPPLSSTHYGRERPCSAEGEKRSSEGQSQAKPVSDLRLGFHKAPLCQQSCHRRAITAALPPKNGKRCAVSCHLFRCAPQMSTHCTLLCPSYPHRGGIIARAVPRSTVSAENSLHNIIKFWERYTCCPLWNLR